MGRGGGSRTIGKPITSEAALNRYLAANPGSPLARELTDFDNNLLSLDFDTGLYTINKSSISALARRFVAQNRDITLGKDYLLDLVQQDIFRTSGRVISLKDAARLYNKDYGIKASAILASANASGATLTPTQRTRLLNATRGGFLNSQFTTASSERGSLANAIKGKRRGAGLFATESARREARRNFLEITGRLR